LITLGYLPSLLGSGFVASRFKHRGTIILSAVCVGIALVGISSSTSLWGIRLGLLMLGLVGGLYLPSGIATVTSLVGSSQWGKALAIHELAPNLGFVAAPLVSEALLRWLSWRGILAFLGVCSAVMGLAFGYFGRGGEFPGEAPSFLSIRTLLAKPAFWIMLVLFALGITASLGVYTMLPLYLVTDRGMERYWANTLVGFSRISGLGMAFLAGWAADRLGSRRVIAWVLLVTGLATVLLGTVPGYWLVIIVFLQPMLAVCFFPAGFAALSQIAEDRSRNVAVSLTIPFAFLLGGGVIPTVIGIMGDAGSFALGMSLVGGFIFMGFLLTFFLKLPND
jgi:NNP family nitrate/nitrite transporter-like MFS transporter